MSDNVFDFLELKEEKVSEPKMSIEDKFEYMKEKCLESDPTDIIILAIDKDGVGQLLHTRTDSRFKLVGALASAQAWLLRAGTATGVID